MSADLNKLATYLCMYDCQLTSETLPESRGLLQLSLHVRHGGKLYSDTRRFAPTVLYKAAMVVPMFLEMFESIKQAIATQRKATPTEK